MIFSIDGSGLGSIWRGVVIAIAWSGLGLLTTCRDVPTEVVGGRVIWQLSGSSATVAPAYDQAAVYFGGYSHEMVAVDKSTGQLRWRSATGVVSGGAFPFTLGFNIVLAGGLAVMGHQHVFAFDAASGAHRWTFRPADGAQPGMGRIATDGATIFAASPEGEVFAIDAQSGTARWSARVPGDSASAYDPVLGSGVVFVEVKRFTNPATGALVAYDKTTGATRWVHEFLPEVTGQYAGCVGDAALYQGTVITSIEDGRVFALDTATGATVWVAPRIHQLPPAGGWNDLRRVSVSGTVVVVGSSTGTVVGYDAATGLEHWRASPAGEISADLSPAATDDSSAYVNFAADLVALDTRSGVVKWQTGLVPGVGGEYWPKPAIDGDRLYVGGVHGFYALRR
ncbi:MAG TPA: PQQ-binding-like beta-propeller repeat protein [Gemmatimonadaceae bacterium]